MKIIKISSVISLLIFLISCQPDAYQIINQDFKIEKVKYVESKGSTNILYANSINELNASFSYYDIISHVVKDYEITEEGDTVLVTTEQIDTLKLKNDRVPEHLVSFYDENGVMLDFPMSASIEQEGIINVYAQIGDVRAEKPLEVKIQSPPNEHEVLVIPMVFHLIESKDYAFIDISEEQIINVTERLNRIFKNPEYRGANSANPNIRFELAKFSPDGKLLNETGIHRFLSDYDGEDLHDELLQLTSEWHPKNYMNVWICSSSFSEWTLPEDVLQSTDPSEWIKGLDLTAYTDVDDMYDAVLQRNKPERIGLIVGANYAQNTDIYDYRFNSYQWEYEIGRFLGLLNTVYERDNQLVDGDIDYCPDTYSYSKTYSNSKEKRNVEGLYYDSENIMDQITTNKLVSAHQTNRLRWVLNNCPSRQAWKSDAALTGVFE